MILLYGLVLGSAAAEPAAPERRPVRFGHVALVGGAVLTTAGTTAWGWSVGSAHQARDAGWRAAAVADQPGWFESRDAWRTTRTPYRLGVTATGTGAALVTAGVVDLLVARSRRKTR